MCNHCLARIKRLNMRKQIDYKSPFTFHYKGRNGTFKCKALLIDSSTHFLNFYPINSQNDVANCMIEYPTQEIDALIELLQQIKKENE